MLLYRIMAYLKSSTLDFCKSLSILFYILFIVCNTWSSDQTDDKVTNISEISNVKETLIYGIEAEIVNFVKSLNEPLSDEYMDLIHNRYTRSSQPATKIALLNYFTRCTSLKESIVNLIYEDALSETIDRQVKVNIFYTLAKHGREEHFHFLIEQLDDDDRIVYSSASAAIKNIKDKSIAPKILEKLKEADASPDINLNNDVRNNLILVLGELEYEEAAEYLREVLESTSSDNFLIMYSMYSLAKIKDIESIDLINNRLNSKEKRIRDYAAYSLSSFKSDLMENIYREMLLHNDADVRVYACRGAVTNKFYSLMDILLYRFNRDPEAKVKSEALKSLVLLGDKGISAVKDNMKGKKYNNSHLFVISDSLSSDPLPEIVQYVMELYKDADKAGREIIARNAVKIHSNNIDPLIKLLLESEDHMIRVGALNAVLSIIDTTLTETVKFISENDRVQMVKDTALRVLSVMGSRK